MLRVCHIIVMKVKMMIVINDNNYEYYESEQYDEEYRPSSSNNYNLDHQPGVVVMTAVIYVM